MGKKLVTMLVSVGFFAVLITVFNLMALQAIREKNNVLIEQFEQYEEAVVSYRITCNNGNQRPLINP